MSVLSRPTRPLSRCGRWAVGVATVLAAWLTVGAAVLGETGPADAAVVAPRTPAGLPSAIEDPADYVPQVACDPRVGAGTRMLATLLTATYRATTPTTWASVYACGTDGTTSEHYDGRALDWMVDVTNPAQRAAAYATIAWLLATDAEGHRFAMARHLGVMYLIYDNRMWGTWDGRWEDYNGCLAKARQKAAFANSCHRTHLHISLSWAGAQGRTSFWTRRVAGKDFGPCRPADLAFAPRYTRANPTGCPRYPAVVAPQGASATKRALVTWSGAWLGRGSTGPAVVAVQRALHLPLTGTYAGRTVLAVGTFQRTQHLAVTGAMNQPTWRALLAAVH